MTSAELAAEGWYPVSQESFPPSDRVLEWARDERVFRQPPWFGRWCDQPPEFNVAGLWWREP